MHARNSLVVALFLLASTATSASAAPPASPPATLPLSEVVPPWLELVRSGDPVSRDMAGTIMVDLVKKHPTLAKDLVNRMVTEDNAEMLGEFERRLVPLAKESPATVSALIRLIRHPETNYRARNFGVKVLSQVGTAAATKELVDAWSETYCPVPGSLLRVVRSMGKDSAPVLAAAYRHPNENVRKWATIGIKTIGRTEPTVQKLSDALQSERQLVKQLREGPPAERAAAVTALAELARTTPGTVAVLVNALNNETNNDVLAEAERRLIELGREFPEAVAALVAGVRDEENYRLLKLGVRVLPKVGANLNSKEIIDALGDDSCPVPYAMQKILLAAGSDAMPVLLVARKHANPEIRAAAENIIRRMPKPNPVTVVPQP